MDSSETKTIFQLLDEMEDDICWAGADDLLDGIFSLDGVDPALDILNLPTIDAPDSLGLPQISDIFQDDNKIQIQDDEEQVVNSSSSDHVSSDGGTSDSGHCSDIDVVDAPQIDCTNGIIPLDEDEEISPAYSPAVSSPGPSVSEVGVVYSPDHASSVLTSGSSGDSDDMCSSVNESIQVTPEKRSRNRNHQSAPRIINLQSQKPLQYGRKQNYGITKSNSGTNTYTISSAPNMNQSSSSSSNNQNVRKVIRLSTVNSGNTNNPRSILLPVTIKDMKDLRTIKIINASGLKKTSAGIKLAAANLLQQGKQGLLKNNVVLTQQQLGLDDSFSEKGCNSDDSVLYDEHYEEEGESAYPRLVLTAEEQRLLIKEGITLPSNYPLTKHEERELKRIRRKIRNKISAQDSRKRKKEYVDGLEDRVKQCTEENQSLMKRIKVLQNQNQSLATQLRKLHSMLAKGTNKTTQPATCLMVLLLSMALIAVPSLRPGGTSVASQQELAAQQRQQSEAQQRGENMMASTRRSLLYTNAQGYMEEPIDDDLNMDDLLTFHSDHDYPVIMKRASKPETTANGSPRKRVLIDLPVDDTWPPPKMKKYDKNDEMGVLYDEESLDVKSEVEYDYYYPDGTLEPDGVINMYDPLEEMLEGPGSVYTIGGKIGELLDVGVQQVSEVEMIGVDAKNKSKKVEVNQGVVVQVTEGKR
ncbi:probable basic-leucine zipper transcription factor J isoform X2 [Ctenocephalides felis]|uniref:probable basic-leucine zipper transcription factor J isoform X2 n=1 Tax=Ctenocephalides felis TaxID=7515 RepID=UPI000E6E4E83|nr:probable basic-leucine zipper transcription factor J isoform X2 [Ctenocephalides felis]